MFLRFNLLAHFDMLRRALTSTQTRTFTWSILPLRPFSSASLWLLMAARLPLAARLALAARLFQGVLTAKLGMQMIHQEAQASVRPQVVRPRPGPKWAGLLACLLHAGRACERQHGQKPQRPQWPA